MAQAARLNLRMQKELKLLLTDPPPAASFPTLSDADSSFTSIDALLQGPEGTVYSNGVFKIKIQIPERYPFQPPIVTFATPIYHPDIDNGGRICLDILNLPPKSRDYKYNRQAFDQNARSMTEKYAQAVVTDITRCENGSQIHTGQTTSQTKMEGSVASVCISVRRKLSLESPGCSNNRRDSSEMSKVPVQNISKNHIEIGPVKEASKDSSKYTWSFGKLHNTRYKLSSKVPAASHSRNIESENTSMSNQFSSVLENQATSDFPESSVQVGKMASIRDKCYVEKNYDTSVGKGLKSLHRVRTEPTRDSDEKSQSIPECTVSHLASIRPQEGLLLSLDSNHSKTNPPKDASARKGNYSTSIRLNKRGLVGLKPSSEPLGCLQNHTIDHKENLAPLRCLLPKLTDQAAASAMISAVVPESGMFNETEKKSVTAAPKLSEMALKLPLEPLKQLLGSNKNVILQPTDDAKCGKKQHLIEVCDGESANTFKKLDEGIEATDAVIVLDSEDSDDENVPVRSKLSLAKQCWSRKRKSGL